MPDTVPEEGWDDATLHSVREVMRPDCDPAKHLTFAQNKQRSHMKGFTRDYSGDCAVYIDGGPRENQNRPWHSEDIA